MAAIFAARKGHKVRLLGEGTGLIHLSSGCIDVLGVLPEAPFKYEEDPLAAFDRLCELVPTHPYAQIGKKTLEESISLFQEVTHICGLQYLGEIRKNRFFITAAGTLKHSCYYPYSFNTPDPREIEAIRFLDIKGVRGFFPALATALSRKIFPTIPVDYHELDLFDELSERNTPLALSRRFFSLSHRERFMEKVGPFCEKGYAIGIPAIFPPLAAREIIQRLRKIYTVFLFEMATIPPSLPGYHLGQSLLEYAVSLGVEPFIGGKVISFDSKDDSINSVEIERPGRNRTIRGDHFLLATGSLLGGGLVIKRDKIQETLFHLPVEAPERDRWFGKSFYSSRHEIRKAGIRVDDEMKPINDKGKPLFRNLHAAGTILAGADIITERSGGGLCLSSALKAVHALQEVPR